MERARFLTTTAYGLAAAPALATAAFAQQTVSLKIGFLDSFTGANALAASHHQAGAALAIAELNRQSHRVQYALVPGDDEGRAPTALFAVRRLVEQEKVDVLFGGTSSACALTRAATAATLGVFDLELGADDPRLTGTNATRTTYRFAPSRQMKAAAVARYAASLGRRTFLIQRDDDLGAQGYAVLNGTFAQAGRTVAGHDTVTVDGTTQQLADPSVSTALSAARQSQAELIVLAVRSADVPAIVAAIVQSDPARRTEIAALDELPDGASLAADGVIFPVIWSPDASPAARALASRLAAAVNGAVTSNHYLGYTAMMNLGDVLARARTTETARLAGAFDQPRPFEAAKTTRSFWQSCDHQCAQDVYVGRWSRPGGSQTAMSPPFRIVSTLPAASSDPCTAPPAQAAQTALRSQHITSRGDYTPKTW